MVWSTLLNVFLFIVYLIFLFIFCSSLANLVKGFSRIEQLVAWFLILCADTVLVLEIASLFEVFDQPFFLTLIQGVLTGVAILVNRHFHFGFPDIKELHIKQKVQAFWQQIRSHRWLTAFVLIIGLNYALLAACILLFPQNITDTLYNHLSRIGYWIQQGSLKHYEGFATVGMIYPYNNSLLISLPIVFLKTDMFAGFTQFFSAIVCMMSVYLLSIGMGLKKINGLIASVIVLTYPIIIYESITAQNDLLVAAFIAASFAMLVSFINTRNKKILVFSLLALALSLGTNQYALIMLPAYCALFIYGIGVTKSPKIKSILKYVLNFLLLFLLFGSYSYLQNFVIYGSPFGPKGFVENVTHISNLRDLPPKLLINSSRLFGQFISCDGLPPKTADFCLSTKEKVLTPILTRDITSDRFLYGSTPYDLSRPNIYNAELSWFGLLSWILILPSFVYCLYKSIKKRNYLNLILLLSPLTFFIFIQFAKFGWDPYQGRYLITAIVLIQPFTAWIFESKKLINKIFTSLICVSSLFIMVYATLNNVSLPITSTNGLIMIERWGKEHSVLIQKIAYKLKPFVMADRDVWSLSHTSLMTMSDHQFGTPVDMVEKYVPLEGSLGIISDFNEFPDYLFRGSQVRRSLSRIILPDFNENVSYILLAPEYEETSVPGFKEIERSNHWVILERSDA